MDTKRGRVFSFDAVERNGYIRYSAGERLKDIFFQSEVPLHAGDTVEFVPAVGAGGIEFAVSVKLIFKRVTAETALNAAPPDSIHSEGVIAAFDPKTGVYWIDSRGHRIVSHINEIVRNKIGSRLFPIGCPVEFEWRLTPRGPRAFVVSDVSAATAAIDLSTYQEIGWLCSWDLQNRFGWIVRPRPDGEWTTVGDELFASHDEVRTQGEEDFPGGVWLRYKVGTRIKKGRRVYFARETEVLESAPEPEIAPEGSIEAQFLSAPELPVEPATAPAEPRIYSDSDRRKSLRQLILEQKLAA